jgi:type IV pilus assembly protein PilE
MTRMKKKRTWGQDRRMGAAAGFFLVELMVTVAIVVIVAAVAYPSYREQVRRGSRAEIKGALLEDAQFLERNYTVSNCYHLTNCADATKAVTLPRLQSPAPPGAAKYNITVVYSADANGNLGQGFTLSAAPTGTMTGDACGTFTLNQAGVQEANDVVACWQR